MYLLDKPFVSDFLIQTIKEKRYKVVATKAAKELVSDQALEWISEEEASMILKQYPTEPIYSNSENALSWITQHLGEHELSKQIDLFKDKVKFRAFTKHLFPDFYFEQIKLEDIQKRSPENLSFPLVIKPSIGFFSIGVHIVANEQDWAQVQDKLKPEKLNSLFPANVLNTNHFIIEEFIEGEEYAVDYYYNDVGEVVLLNVMHHLFSSGKDTSDRVYTTSKEIITKHQSNIEDFLGKIGHQLNLKKFPAHAEVRIDASGKIVPIEINPLRFGGWCTTGDLLGVTLGFNSYQCFVENKRPDWETIFEGKEDKKYSVVILDNSTGVAPNDIEAFNYSELANHFENPMLVRKLDIDEYPIFGFVFAETLANNTQELTHILKDDLKKYLILK